MQVTTTNLFKFKDTTAIEEQIRDHPTRYIYEVLDNFKCKFNCEPELIVVSDFIWYSLLANFSFCGAFELTSGATNKSGKGLEYPNKFMGISIEKSNRYQRIQFQVFIEARSYWEGYLDREVWLNIRKAPFGYRW